VIALNIFALRAWCLEEIRSLTEQIRLFEASEMLVYAREAGRLNDATKSVLASCREKLSELQHLLSDIER
jgi:hypothetical protein